MSDLIKRLRGKYSVGPDGVYEDRDFGSFTPAITNEAADRIEQLKKENALYLELLDQCAAYRKTHNHRVLDEKLLFDTVNQR